MPLLTRRRSKDDPHRETWLIYFGDVRVGAIGRRAGVPNSAPQWGWSCGFYPGTARANSEAVLLRHSTRPAPASKPLGKSWRPPAQRPITRRGAASETGRLGR